MVKIVTQVLSYSCIVALFALQQHRSFFMSNLSQYGQGIVNDLSGRYGISRDAVVCMIQAVINGNGTMAQFYCPELGGGGQWMMGGMTMVGDMFNNGLKNTVNNLCSEISGILSNGQMIFEKPAGQSAAQNGNWWPSELGYPSSSGSQNNFRYAIFPGSRRLALQVNGQVTVYDTLDHQIGGVGQQQGNNSSATFTSQFGTVYLENLPIISGNAPWAPAPAASSWSSNSNNNGSNSNNNSNVNNNPAPVMNSAAKKPSCCSVSDFLALLLD
jgi:hypothetical protein